jgi:hypothetical protein
MRFQLLDIARFFFMPLRCGSETKGMPITEAFSASLQRSINVGCACNEYAIATFDMYKCQKELTKVAKDIAKSGNRSCQPVP